MQFKSAVKFYDTRPIRLRMLYNKNSLELFWNQLKANLIGHVPSMILHKMSGIIFVCHSDSELQDGHHSRTQYNKGKLKNE